MMMMTMMMMRMMQVILFGALLVLAASAHTQFYLPIDCDDIYRHDNTSSSGVYTIYPGSPTTPLQVYCDMDTDGGGWTVIHRRIDGTGNFFRPWRHYKTGFGDVAGEYWLGLDNIILLSMRKKNELRVDMEDWEGGKASAQYSSFSIDTENAGYQLHIGNFTGGAAGDGLGEHNNMKFTTFDKYRYLWENNCILHFLDGFWYGNCHRANSTGMYAPHGAFPYTKAQVTWRKWKGANYSLKTLAMKIRSAATCTCTHQPD